MGKPVDRDDTQRRPDRDSTSTTLITFIDHARGRSHSESPVKTRHRPKSPYVQSSAERIARRRPTPLNLNDARKYGSSVTYQKMEAVHLPLITPAEAQRRQTNDDGSSSVYNDNSPMNSAPTVSPLRINKRPNVLQSYSNWRDMTSPAGPTPARQLRSPFETRPGRSKSVNQATDHLEILPATTYQPPEVPATSPSHHHLLKKSATTNEFSRDELPQTAQTDQFTPLTPWLMSGGKRKASKTLFGDHGWLHDTEEKKKNVESHSQKAAGFFVGLKKKAREFAENTILLQHASRRLPNPNRLNISLDPREQSLLYCELEFILSNALDAYIKSQLNGGRLDPDKLKKVADGWTSKGRPRVVGFRYDLETQLELIGLHSGQFRFYGAAASQLNNEGVVHGLLGAMKGNARSIRLRTLCQPDSVVAKHILDSQALLQLIGAIESLQISMAEVSQFFKVVVEREKAISEAAEKRANANGH